jgi:hypothetical protein
MPKRDIVDVEKVKKRLKGSKRIGGPATKVGYYIYKAHVCVRHHGSSLAAAAA